MRNVNDQVETQPFPLWALLMKNDAEPKPIICRVVGWTWPSAAEVVLAPLLMIDGERTARTPSDTEKVYLSDDKRSAEDKILSLRQEKHA
jgi:hypothetical protein